MASSTGNLEGALGGLLPAHIFEVNGIVLGLAQQRVAIHFERQDAVARIHEADDIQQRLYGIDFDPTDHGCLAGIQFRHNQARDLLTAGFNGDG